MVGLGKCSPQDEAGGEPGEAAWRLPCSSEGALMHLDPKRPQNWDAMVPSCASPRLRIFLSHCILHLVRFLVCALRPARIATAYQGLRAVSLLEKAARQWLVLMVFCTLNLPSLMLVNTQGFLSSVQKLTPFPKDAVSWAGAVCLKIPIYYLNMESISSPAARSV